MARRAQGRRASSCLWGRGLMVQVASCAAKAVDRREVLFADLVVADAESVLGSQAEDADLPLVGVLVYVEGCLPDLVEGVGPRQGGVDHALGDEAVGLPGLAVVGEVRADDPLEVHPQVAVVVLVHVTAGRGAGDDRAALSRGEHRGPEGLPAGVLEDDVDVLTAGELADVLAEATPLLGVLGVLVLPELVAGLGAVDDQLGA